ncbi:hypothetical protein [Alteromonas sp. C1M14]|uniref:hypothetical protein n=1 Tax=Alteromonas sp. C1M14 TaxID=2841567 RepID=UPI001C08A5DD|nr:hypothetical protein [Alteromonas sp. C1M14]MBU2977881.1 hypothetical protein [Alteromonas sp. C1M14]
MNMTVIAIVAICAWALVKITRNTKNNQPNKKSAQQEAALQQEIDALRDRIEVLEKIVTDDNYDLKKQFKDLEKDQIA